MRPQFAVSVQMLKHLGETPVPHRNRFANCVNDRLACRRSTGVHSSELEPRTAAAAAAAAAAIAGTAEIVGDRYDYLLKYLFHHYFESIMLPTIIIDCHERAYVDSGTGWNRYRKRHSIAQPFSPDGWNTSQWDAIADVVASCDAAAEAALQRADCGFDASLAQKQHCCSPLYGPTTHCSTYNRATRKWGMRISRLTLTSAIRCAL